MKQIILTNWTPVRILRLLIALAILVQAIRANDILFGVAGLLFAGMAVFNMGCCGVNGCAVPTRKTPAKLNENEL